MPRAQRHRSLPNEVLEPTWSPGDISPEDQTILMQELRELTNSIASAYRTRDERLLALAASGSLSRRDMATATGLNKSRVDQIIREMAEADRTNKNEAARNRVARHLCQ